MNATQYDYPMTRDQASDPVSCANCNGSGEILSKQWGCEPLRMACPMCDGYGWSEHCPNDHEGDRCQDRRPIPFCCSGNGVSSRPSGFPRIQPPR